MCSAHSVKCMSWRRDIDIIFTHLHVYTCMSSAATALWIQMHVHTAFLYVTMVPWINVKSSVSFVEIACEWNHYCELTMYLTLLTARFRSSHLCPAYRHNDSCLTKICLSQTKLSLWLEDFCPCLCPLITLINTSWLVSTSVLLMVQVKHGRLETWLT